MARRRGAAGARKPPPPRDIAWDMAIVGVGEEVVVARFVVVRVMSV